ncbi:MAG TPA: FtsX-like permease family protein [Gammaproteobacteria bacterium]|nr:FtsX-like permease family protein [Gammaproteobacteria bacterium]
MHSPQWLALHEPLESQVAGSLARDRPLLAFLSGLLGAVSLLLVAIGFYGLMAYSVTRCTAEIGVRVALGAQARSVLAMVLRDALGLVAASAAVGIAAALGASQVIASLLYGVTPRDVPAFLAAFAALALVAMLAALLPTRRAARVDPMVALRYE